MRKLLLAGLIGCWTGALALACGDDSSGTSGSNQTGDSGAVPPGAGGDGGSTFSINATDITVYVGNPATIDASGTAATTFAWVVKSAPAGSAITTATLQGGTSSRPSFTPDLSGDYVLELTAGANGQTSTKAVTVKAAAAPVFFMQTNFTENPSYFEYRTIGNDKSNNHPIDCRLTDPEQPDSGPDETLVVVSFLFADIGLDSWEAPPGTPSRVAFSQLQFAPDGGTDAFLSLGTNESTCQARPTIVRRVKEDGGEGDGQLAIIQPRIAPDGQRVAYVESKVAGWKIVTVAFDGNDRRELAPFCTDSGNCFGGDAPFAARPQWVDAHTVGWVRARPDPEDGGPPGWEVMTASDSANPSPQTFMTCNDGAVPRSIVFLKDGSILANPVGADKIEDLIVYKPATPGGTCTKVRNLTNLATPNSYARDFSVSPDEGTVAFIRNLAPDGGVDSGSDNNLGGILYLAAINGSSPPKPLNDKEQFALFGARFIAGGSQVSWNGALANTVDPNIVDAGLGNLGILSINTAALSGGATTNLVVSNPDAGIIVAGGGNGGGCNFSLGCELSNKKTTAGGLGSIGFIALAFGLRRRKKKN